MSFDVIKDLNNYIVEGKGNYLDLVLNFEVFIDLFLIEMIKNMKNF